MLFQLINENLISLNSRFLITDIIDKKEFINFILYFVLEYDIIGELIEKINNCFKNYILVNFDNLFKMHIDNKNLNIDNGKNLKSIKNRTKDGFIFQNFMEFLNTAKIKEIYKTLSDKDELRTLFNKMNHVLKSLKRQTDNFINLSFKLSQLIKNQEKPLKYTFNIFNVIYFSNN